jgi:hypothetical protein
MHYGLYKTYQVTVSIPVLPLQSQWDSFLAQSKLLQQMP